MIITLKTHDKAQSMSILRYLKEHGATYTTSIKDDCRDPSNEVYVINVKDDDKSMNAVSDLLNLR